MEFYKDGELVATDPDGSEHLQMVSVSLKVLDENVLLDIQETYKIRSQYYAESDHEIFNVYTTMDENGFRMNISVFNQNAFIMNGHSRGPIFPPDEPLVHRSYLSPHDVDPHGYPVMKMFADGATVLHCDSEWKRYKIVFDIEAWKARKNEECVDALPEALPFDIRYRIANALLPM